MAKRQTSTVKKARTSRKPRATAKPRTTRATVAPVVEAAPLEVGASVADVVAPPPSLVTPAAVAEDLDTSTRAITVPVDAAGNPERRYVETDAARNEVRVYELSSIDGDGVRHYRHVSTERLM